MKKSLFTFFVAAGLVSSTAFFPKTVKAQSAPNSAKAAMVCPYADGLHAGENCAEPEYGFEEIDSAESTLESALKAIEASSSKAAASNASRESQPIQEAVEADVFDHLEQSVSEQEASPAPAVEFEVISEYEEIAADIATEADSDIQEVAKPEDCFGSKCPAETDNAKQQLPQQIVEESISAEPVIAGEPATEVEVYQDEYSDDDTEYQYEYSYDDEEAYSDFEEIPAKNQDADASGDNDEISKATANNLVKEAVEEVEVYPAAENDTADDSDYEYDFEYAFENDGNEPAKVSDTKVAVEEVTTEEVAESVPVVSDEVEAGSDEYELEFVEESDSVDAPEAELISEVVEEAPLAEETPLAVEEPIKEAELVEDYEDEYEEGWYEFEAIEGSVETKAKPTPAKEKLAAEQAAETVDVSEVTEELAVEDATESDLLTQEDADLTESNDSEPIENDDTEAVAVENEIEINNAEELELVEEVAVDSAAEENADVAATEELDTQEVVTEESEVEEVATEEASDLDFEENWYEFGFDDEITEVEQPLEDEVASDETESESESEVEEVVTSEEQVEVGQESIEEEVATEEVASKEVVEENVPTLAEPEVVKAVTEDATDTNVPTLAEPEVVEESTEEVVEAVTEDATEENVPILAEPEVVEESTEEVVEAVTEDATEENVPTLAEPQVTETVTEEDVEATSDEVKEAALEQSNEEDVEAQVVEEATHDEFGTSISETIPAAEATEDLDEAPSIADWSEWIEMETMCPAPSEADLLIDAKAEAPMVSEIIVLEEDDEADLSGNNLGVDAAQIGAKEDLSPLWDEDQHCAPEESLDQNFDSADELETEEWVDPLLD